MSNVHHDVPEPDAAVDRALDELRAHTSVDLGAPMSRQLLDASSAAAPVAAPLPVRRLLGWAAVAVVWAAACVLLLKTRRDLGELPPALVLGTALVWLAGVIAPALVLFVPARGNVLARYRLAGVLGLLVALGLVALGAIVHPSGPSSTVLGWPGAWRGHTCVELGVATALVPMLVGLWALRRSLPYGERWAATALGAASGAAAGLMLLLHCPIADAPHVALMHGGMVAVSAGVAALLGARFLRI